MVGVGIVAGARAACERGIFVHRIRRERRHRSPAAAGNQGGPAADGDGLQKRGGVNPARGRVSRRTGRSREGGGGGNKMREEGGREVASSVAPARTNQAA